MLSLLSTSESPDTCVFLRVRSDGLVAKGLNEGKVPRLVGTLHDLDHPPFGANFWR